MNTISRLKKLSPIGRIVFFASITIALAAMALAIIAFVNADTNPNLSTTLNRIDLGLLALMLVALIVNSTINGRRKSDGAVQIAESIKPTK